MNSTTLNLTSSGENTTPYSLAISFAILSIIIGSFLIILIYRTKPRLHTCRHLLMCNSSLALILYCINQNISYFFRIFWPWDSNDIACRWRAYAIYTTIAAASYSYLIQTLSRLSHLLVLRKHSIVFTFEIHRIMIMVNWLLAILIALPAVITNDIRYVPGMPCAIPFHPILHRTWNTFMTYIVPLVFIGISYSYIYYRVKRNRASMKNNRSTTNHTKLHFEILRNILLLMSILTMGETPTILLTISGMKIFFSIGLVSGPFCAMLLQICTILLDQELREIVRRVFHLHRRVAPIEHLNLK